MEILRAGRELDALVAEKVMGMSLLKLNGWGPLVDGMDREPPRFSTDIAAAWRVVELVQKEKGQDFRIDRLNWGGSMQDWVAGFGSIATGHGEGTHLAQGRADTAAHAICLAALKAVDASQRRQPMPG